MSVQIDQGFPSTDPRTLTFGGRAIEEYHRLNKLFPGISLKLYLEEKDPVAEYRWEGKTPPILRLIYLCSLAREGMYAYRGSNAAVLRVSWANLWHDILKLALCEALDRELERILNLRSLVEPHGTTRLKQLFKEVSSFKF